MPSPMDTLLRIHDSPVPTQTTLEFLGSIVMAPIDCTGSWSKTGLKVVPPVTGFHTPPPPPPAARRAEVGREPVACGPARDRGDAAAHRRRADVARAEARDRFGVDFHGRGRGLLHQDQHQSESHGWAPGRANRWSSSGTLASILS